MTWSILIDLLIKLLPFLKDLFESWGRKEMKLAGKALEKKGIEPSGADEEAVVEDDVIEILQATHDRQPRVRFLRRALLLRAIKVLPKQLAAGKKIPDADKKELVNLARLAD